MKMDTLLLLCCLVLTTSHHLLCSAHMEHEDELSTNKYVQSNIQSVHQLQSNTPPVVVVEIPKSVKNRKGKKQKKNKLRAKRPPPPANCVPLWASCKTAGNACCDSCAFCKCRLFRTVCFCRMGNPQC